MKRAKRHKVKKEKTDASSSKIKGSEEHDLAYYIHDRVELMHQVFSLIKYKDIKAMAPVSVKNLPLGDLQELCTEELLGISSKRLVAILDGAEPPSDTESSSQSPERFETISLDSISSDEELLSQESGSKKKKHKHRSHSKSKCPRSPSELGASRAGMTVLELLELQARARAIRAQLQQVQNIAHQSVSEEADAGECSDVEIKEETPDVVEISSDEEKPNVQQDIASASPKQADKPQTNTQADGQKITKRINDLIITVPQKSTRKIKLNRNKTITNVSSVDKDGNTSKEADNVAGNSSKVTENNAKVTDKNINNTRKVVDTAVKETQKDKAATVTENKSNESKVNESEKKVNDKRKKSKRKKAVIDKDSDHDEITLQLSDSEKMDLLEDFNNVRKEYSSTDTDTSDTERQESKDKVQDKTDKDNKMDEKDTKTQDKITENSDQTERSDASDYNSPIESINKADNSKFDVLENSSEDKNIRSNKDNKNLNDKANTSNPKTDITKGNNLAVHNNEVKGDESINVIEEITENDRMEEASNEKTNDTVDNSEETSVIISADTIKNDNIMDITENIDNISNVNEKNNDINVTVDTRRKINEQTATEVTCIDDIPTNKDESEQNNENIVKSGVIIHNLDEEDKTTQKTNKSDGELSDRDSSEVEAIDLKPEVVCVSDDETKQKKKKKKDKKSKKDKKKKKQDFQESGDENFYKDKEDKGHVSDSSVSDTDKIKNKERDKSADVDQNADTDKIDITSSDDVYEILELSDDSSCYEVEGTVLSKEPTAEEIAALSAKIDMIDIDRQNIVTDEEIRQHEELLAKEASWKDRYLESAKVKKVLTTSNILNALKKKNRQLKQKIEESKCEEKNNEQVSQNNEEVIQKPLEEGSVELYNTLESRTQYVDPVKSDEELKSIEEASKSTEEGKVSKEMKKDAKQLLKMYKKLLKYNDMNRKSDPNKKKSKKKKKKCNE